MDKRLTAIIGVMMLAGLQAIGLSLPEQAEAIFSCPPGTTCLNTLSIGAPKRLSGHEEMPLLSFSLLASQTPTLYYAASQSDSTVAYNSFSGLLADRSFDSNTFTIADTLAVVGDFTADSTYTAYANTGIIQIAQGSSLTFAGDFSQAAGAALQIEIGNATPFGFILNYAQRSGTRGLLNAGNMDIAGDLFFDYATGFDLSGKAGQSLLLFDPQTLNIANLKFTDPNVRLGVYNTGPDGTAEVWATVVPEPSTIILLGVGLAGLVGAGIRKRRKMYA